MADVKIPLSVVVEISESNSNWIHFINIRIQELINEVDRHIDIIDSALEDAEKNDVEDTSFIEKVYEIRLEKYRRISQFLKDMTDLSSDELDVIKGQLFNYKH